MSCSQNTSNAKRLAEIAFRFLWQTTPIDIHLAVIRYLSIRELAVISASGVYSVFVTAEFMSRLRGLLTEWMLDCGVVLRLMDETRSVMIGSGALYIVSPSNWWPNNLDICCPCGGLDAVLAILQDQGYVITEGEEKGGYPAAGIVKTCVTMAKTRQGLRTLEIKVMESAMPCAEAPTFFSHSTLLMNVVTAKGAFCYYPEFTLNDVGQRVAFNVLADADVRTGVIHFVAGYIHWLREEDEERSAHQKYRERGYRLELSCKELHATLRGDVCSVCTNDFRSWRAGAIRLPFRQGDILDPAGRGYVWRLGGDATENRGWRDRGAVVLVQGNLPDHGYLYDGLNSVLGCVTRETMEGWV
ncbi:hypothetical protein NMY22_g4487 [Coprinellus aureogranulatus]|nr:hypothetical protein NMY22_g4487 [Coprinellus aureogranulatus]